MESIALLRIPCLGWVGLVTGAKLVTGTGPGTDEGKDGAGADLEKGSSVLLTGGWIWIANGMF